MNLTRIYRSLLVLILTLLVFTFLPAQIRLAALGGIQSSNLIEKNSIPGYDTARGNFFSPNTGFQLGVLAEIPFGKHNLYLQPGILYSSKGNQFQRFYDSSVYQTDTLYNQYTLNLNYVEIPLYLTWKLTLSKDQKNNFFISAGPYFAFIYSANQSYQNRVLQYNSSNYIYQSGTEDLPVGIGPQKYKTYDIGIDAKAGFELGNVIISAYFSRGLTNAYTALYPSSFHNQVFGGSFGIWLNNPKPVSQPSKDSDNDGTPDRDDSCKTIPGPPRWHGCPIPDSDHDGINDEEDSCKTIPGLFRYHGCPIPDTDKDGVNDEEDSCKTVPGLPRYHGCPIPDRDQDGVNDELDKCPDQPGPAENQGCPVVKAAIINRAQLVAANVMFDVNSTSLTAGSYPAIKELADSLKTNPDLNLLIEGHTDDAGNPSYNQKLSINRAETVKKVLIKLGIAASRIQTKGYGDFRPVATNDNPEGRAKNRRVVFVFQLKNR
ncbi:MAG TPA: OmpA family protein [Puia sp.]|jgi:OOP family OmpA-OmpF porin|nr:OmpA family protein [Puia sp.]